MDTVPCMSLLIFKNTEAVKYGLTAGSFKASVHSVAACTGKQTVVTAVCLLSLLSTQAIDCSLQKRAKAVPVLCMGGIVVIGTLVQLLPGNIPS